LDEEAKNPKTDSFFASDYEDSSDEEPTKETANTNLDIYTFKFFHDYRELGKNECVRVRGLLKLLFNKAKSSMKEARDFIHNGIDGRTPRCTTCHIRSYLGTLNGLGETAKSKIEHICPGIPCPGHNFCGSISLHNPKNEENKPAKSKNANSSEFAFPGGNFFIDSNSSQEQMQGFLSAFKPPSPQSKTQSQQIQEFEQFATALDFKSMNFDLFQKFYSNISIPFGDWKKYVEEKQKQQLLLQKIQEMQEKGIDIDILFQNSSSK